MIISIASGKGGTGKTTVATNLAVSVSGPVQLLDCDVEEPNGHLFLKPSLDESREVFSPVPVANKELCTGCGLCAKLCQYSAIICMNNTVMTFPELCHGCGGCILVCPVSALGETGKKVGRIESGHANGISFVHGILDIGVAMSPPLIREVKNESSGDGITLIDAPPGTSCPVITSVQDTDFIVLVTEPTPFGLNDLGLAVAMVQELNIPFGVVVNRHQEDNIRARQYCRDNAIRILGEIPDDRRIAEAYSNGKLASEAIMNYESLFFDIWRKIDDTNKPPDKGNNQ